jgi:hypothetical protein
MPAIVAICGGAENPCRTLCEYRARTQKRHLDGGVCLECLNAQCRVFAGAPALGGVMNDPTGTTTCFGFLGFFASLFPRNWPFAMVILLATTLDMSGRIARRFDPTQTDHRPLRGKTQFYIQPAGDRASAITIRRTQRTISHPCKCCVHASPRFIPAAAMGERVINLIALPYQHLLQARNPAMSGADQPTSKRAIQ